jgi:hypothetical protein
MLINKKSAETFKNRYIITQLFLEPKSNWRDSPFNSSLNERCTVGSDLLNMGKVHLLVNSLGFKEAKVYVSIFV